MLRVRFVSAHGSPHADYFPDSLLGLICAEARRRGYDAARLRLHYHGQDPTRDAAIRERFVAWLRESAPDVIFFDRLFDIAPVETYRAIAPSTTVVMLTRGDSVSPMAGVDYLIGATPGLERERTRRSPTPGELCRSSVELLDALERGEDESRVPGVSRMSAEQIIFGTPSTRLPLPRPFAPVLEADVIAPGDARPIERHTLFGNAGCPYGQDPLKQPHFAQLTLPADRPMARLGCAFCCMGGDYDARPDEEVIEELVEQACWLAKHVPDLRELVLEDQAPLRYLGRVLERCAERGAPNLRWLFASRSDALLRQGRLIEEALSTATRTGAELELYLTGFESFCDAELQRFNKGVDVQTQLAAVERCRELRRLHPRHFGFTRARGHSLVLWSPWTTPEDLGESLEQIRAHGLCELFDELGKNRLRLYEDLPLYWAARRDHALLDDWQEGDEGSARLKGYNTERPWRFLDERTRLGYALAEALRARLGAQSEVAQLRAAVEYAQEMSVDPAQAVARVLRDLDALDAQIEPLLGRERDQPARARQRQATPVLFTGPCNNGCLECPQGDVYVDEAELLRRVGERAAGGQALLFAG
ncbi:MAG: hypothetical protein GXP55_18955, partial [Deltaproteobacteria bacterium]|nr:hypothetical protein [Deltaproteobacteria bacterium]